VVEVEDGRLVLVPVDVAVPGVLHRLLASVAEDARAGDEFAAVALVAVADGY
jgi:hypothetical protein